MPNSRRSTTRTSSSGHQARGQLEIGEVNLRVSHTSTGDVAAKRHGQNLGRRLTQSLAEFSEREGVSLSQAGSLISDLNLRVQLPAGASPAMIEGEILRQLKRRLQRRK